MQEPKSHLPNIHELMLHMRIGATEGLRLLAEEILTESNAHVPIHDPAVDPDPAVNLAEIGRIEAHGAGWIIVYEAPYAAKQHENMFLKHPRGGNAKFLENALKGAVPKMEHAVAAAINTNLTRIHL